LAESPLKALKWGFSFLMANATRSLTWNVECQGEAGYKAFQHLTNRKIS